MAPRKDAGDSRKGKSGPRRKSCLVPRSKDSPPVLVQETPEQALLEQADFPLVGIGASLGGPEAFEQSILSPCTINRGNERRIIIRGGPTKSNVSKIAFWVGRCPDIVLLSADSERYSLPRSPPPPTAPWMG